jgi:hypothetical protein
VRSGPATFAFHETGSCGTAPVYPTNAAQVKPGIFGRQAMDHPQLPPCFASDMSWQRIYFHAMAIVRRLDELRRQRTEIQALTIVPTKFCF